jgi:nitroreductase
MTLSPDVRPATRNTDAEVLHRLLDNRFSCRAFLSTPVRKELVTQILLAAQRTASWCNSQPWQVVVTAGEETESFRRHLMRHAGETRGTYDIPPPGRYEGSYKERRRKSGYALYDALGITREDTAGRLNQAFENYRLFGAPHVAIVTSEAVLGPYGYVDCGGYVANFLLAAESLGVATIAQASIANFSDAVREHFSLPESRHVVCGISFGYADTEHPVNRFRTDRADLSESADLRGFDS